MASRPLMATGSLALVVSVLLTSLSVQPSGAVELKSGLLPARTEPYVFTESVKVPLGKVWTVEAGAVLCFAPNTELMVIGTLEVNGTKDKPVLFSSCTPDASWRGMTFNMSRAYKGKKNLLQHVIVERADKSEPEVREHREGTSGGGIQIVKSDVEIADSVIRFNRAADGGGLYIGADSTVTVRRCLIHSNRALGSNYIYSGGGGIYIADPQKASIWRSTIALNSFSSPGYGNEQGGGGLHLEGKGLQMGFNLVVGNESGKGAGLLLNAKARGDEEDELPFIGNVFAYNRGSRNFEQVALQTSYSFQPPTFLNTWLTNIGQFPFVAHLTREKLVRYVDNGDKAFLRQIAPGTHQTTSSFGQLLADRVTKEEMGTDAGDVLAESQLCKNKFDLGPLELCNALDRPNLAEYISRLAAYHGDQEFGKSLLRLLQPGPNLSDYAPLFRYVEDKALRDVPNEYLVMAVGSEEMRSKTIKQVLREPIKTQEARGFTLALWAYALGENQTFKHLVENPDYAKKVLLNAAGNSFLDAALQAYTVAVDPADPNPDLLLETMRYAAQNGLTRLVERLLDDGFDPNIARQGPFPLLALAAHFGHKDVVQLLLRRGANPNFPMPTPSQHKHLIPILYSSVGWYHLGEGFRDIAEMLLAAGADFGSLRFDEYNPSALFLTNILQLGYVLPPGISGTPADYMRTPDNEWDARFAERIKRGEVVQTPLSAKIRELRSKDTNTLLKDLSSSAANNQRDAWQLAATLRILSVRDFDLDETSRRSLFNVYEGQHGNELRKLVPPEEVFLKFRRGLPEKGPQPVAKGDPQAAKGPTQVRNDKRDLPYGRKVAVVIGIADYKNLSPLADAAKGAAGPFNLLFAEKDATDFKALLRSGRMGSNWEIEELVGPAATNKAVDLRLKALQSELKKDDLLLFFFSGHGFADQKDRNSAYLFFQDSSLDKLPQTAMSLGALREWAMGLKAKHVILFLDACRSGLLGTAKGNSTLTYDAFLEAAQFGQSPGKLAITSSLGADQSYEWRERQNGFFTSLLISALTERIARPSSGSYLTIRDIYSALVREVPSETRRSLQRLEQMPYLIQLGGGDILDFPIAIAN